LSFAGIDVSAFDAAEPFGGDFIQFDFSPNASGIDTGADLDVFAVIPLPHPAALAGMGLACVGLVSRRRLG
jgi:hypothetical protein